VTCHPAPDVVAVWQLALDDYTPCESLVSHDERERAARFLHERDSRRFLVCRAALRHILAQYLGTEPLALHFLYNACGKPYLRDELISFNVSHCGGLAMLAFSTGRRVGIDVERIDVERFHTERLKRLLDMLAPNDRDEVMRHDPEQHLKAFLERWTLLEALTKARGESMTLPVRDSRNLTEGFSAIPLQTAPHCIATLAADAAPWRVDYRTALHEPRFVSTGQTVKQQNNRWPSLHEEF
jgi:4'-phosphopantetheinyl transferase